MNEAVEQNKDEISCGERLANKRSEKELTINQVAKERLKSNRVLSK